MIDRIPVDTFQLCVSFLDNRDVSSVERVSRACHRAISDDECFWRKTFEKRQVEAPRNVTYRAACQMSLFGKKMWQKHMNWDVGEEPLLPPDLGNFLMKPCEIFPNKKRWQTHFVFLVPQKINGRNLGTSIFKTIDSQDLRFNSTTLERYELCLENSYWAVMTQNILPNSWNIHYSAQKQMIVDLRKRTKIGYDVPNREEALLGTLASWFTYKNNDSYSFIVCKEFSEISKDPLYVGIDQRYGRIELWVSGFAKKEDFLGASPILRLNRPAPKDPYEPCVIQ